ncbi:hypothetical protein Tco_1225773 [Tanacetum coccineum]
MENIFQIFQDLRFDISFADALLLMPRFAPTIKSLLMNKEKLLELAKIPLNENCSAMLLKNLPRKTLGNLASLLFHVEEIVPIPRESENMPGVIVRTFYLSVMIPLPERFTDDS